MVEHSCTYLEVNPQGLRYTQSGFVLDSDALEPGGSRGVVFLPLWAVLVGYHSLSAEGVSVRWGSLKG